MRTVYLVDDSDGLRHALSDRLMAQGYQVKAFDEPTALLDALDAAPAKKSPSRAGDACFLLDVYMPSMTGLELADRLKEKGHSAPVVFMTGFGDVPLAVEAMGKGAVTFLEKPLTAAHLSAALEKAFSRPSAPEDAPSAEPDFATRADTLSKREKQVLSLVADGMTNKEIGRALDISHRTVEHHRERILTKTGLSNTDDLLAAWRAYADDAAA
ncbi:MAG: response regulator [Pseudomonadota bacterium]